MPEYIEREATCGDCIHSEICEHMPTLTGWDALNPVYCRAFKNAADVRYVIHSKWEITDVDHAHGHKCYHCPECDWDEWRYDPTIFCPNCGARMDGE